MATQPTRKTTRSTATRTIRAPYTPATVRPTICPICGMAEHIHVSPESQQRDVSGDRWALTPARPGAARRAQGPGHAERLHSMTLRELLRQLVRLARMLHAIADELDDLVAGTLPSAGPLDPSQAPRSGGPPDTLPSP